MVRYILISLLLLIGVQSHAFHIVGGEITYEYEGNDFYEITLTVYRDCFSSGAPFDDPAAIGIFLGDGSFYDVVSFFNPDITPVSTTVDFACTDISASACVEKGVYIQGILLPPSTSGYYIAYQRCCRNSTIQNLIIPDEYGATYAAFIPPSTVVEGNSCPVFNDLPPVGLCLDIPFTFDHGAEDIDGDSLVYELCTPYSGANQDVPQPAVPSPPTWPNVQWSAGFSVDNQITADPIFTLDPNTGLLQGTPTQIGQYVMGVCVKEYREGEFLSEVRRDFQFNVVACPSAVLASFADLNQGAFCEGVTIDFENQSANATSFLWDFGDGTTTSAENPSHLFSGVGEYIVTLISEPGEVCADTATTVYTIYPRPDPEILEPILNCPGNTYDLEVGGDLGVIDSYSWTIDSPDGPDFDSAALLEDISFNEAGLTYIEVIVTNSDGCEEEAVYPFDVPQAPVASITPITDPCQGLTIAFNSQSLFTNGLEWDFGELGAFDTDTVDNPIWTYGQSGEYTVTLTASSSVACENTTSIDIEVNPALEVDFMAPDPQCLEGNEFYFEGTGNYTANATFNWSFGDEATLANSSSESPGPISFGEQGNYEIIFTVTEGPCEATDWETIYVVEAVDVDFVTLSEGCAPYDAYFVDQTTGGSNLDYQWEFGDGSTSYFPGSVIHTYPNPGTYGVTLTVASTFGCLSEETVYLPDAVTVAPAPSANFVMDPPFADINSAFLNVTSTAVGSTNCIYLIEGTSPVEECDFSIEFLTGGQYDITQVVTNDYGCEDRITAPFTVTGHSFYAPNAITLNQDGLNDFFVPVVTGEIVQYNMQIFDRWGQVIFETDEVGMPWVPSYAHVGMHAFRVTLRDSYNVTQVYEGTFSLIR